MLPTDLHRAAAYAAQKYLEDTLANDENLTPGFEADLSGFSVTIKFPQGTKVKREAGKAGDGIVEKKPTQNLYGYAFWLTLAKVLKRFNQWNTVKKFILLAAKEALQNKIPLETKLEQIDPEFQQELENIKEEIVLPMRLEPTPRNLTKPKNQPPTITFTKPSNP